MFILRTTQMPSLQQLTELEQIVAVDNAGPNLPTSTGTVRGVLVGECLQGPFVPTVVNAPADVTSLYFPNAGLFTLLSQSGPNGPWTSGSDVQDGSGGAFDGNVWAELKGKTISGLVIQRVDCDMVTANGGSSKAYVQFTVTVNAADQTAGVTNKDLVIPAGTRFADAVLGSATAVVALSQQLTIPAGTTVTSNAIAVGISLQQDLASGQLTFVSTGATLGATCFFVKGQKATTAGSNPITVPIDYATGGTPIPGSLSTIATGSVSTVNGADAGTDVYAPSGGATQPASSLSDCIAANYAAAISKTLPGTDATNDIVVIWSARNFHMANATASTMRKNLWQNAVNSSAVGRGRVAMVTSRQGISTAGTEAVAVEALYQGQVAADSVVGADADRYWVCGPYVQVFSTELNADITISACGARAAMKVNLANNGESEYLTSVGDPENANIQNVDAQETLFTINPLVETDYIAMKAAGVAWLVQDRNAGWWFYSGVTGANPVTYNNRVDDNRRSFADEIQDMIFFLASKYAKKPGTTSRADAFASDMTVYLESLVNPPIGDARAAAYQVLEGAAAGNSPTLNAQGVYLFIANVQMNGSMKTIVINTQIGPNVVIAQVA
jgi:hypothetical protein